MEQMQAKVDLLNKYFTRAFHDVMASMSGILITETSEIADYQTTASELSGAMTLVGEKNILLMLSMSLETARFLISAMTGSPLEKLQPEDLYDGVAELVNMVAGETKAIVSATSHRFQLTTPFTVVGKGHFIVCKNRTTAFFKCFRAEDQEIILKVYFM